MQYAGMHRARMFSSAYRHGTRVSHTWVEAKRPNGTTFGTTQRDDKHEFGGPRFEQSHRPESSSVFFDWSALESHELNKKELRYELRAARV